VVDYEEHYYCVRESTYSTRNNESRVSENKYQSDDLTGMVYEVDIGPTGDTSFITIGKHFFSPDDTITVYGNEFTIERVPVSTIIDTTVAAGSFSNVKKFVSVPQFVPQIILLAPEVGVIAMFLDHPDDGPFSFTDIVQYHIEPSTAIAEYTADKNDSAGEASFLTFTRRGTDSARIVFRIQASTSAKHDCALSYHHPNNCLRIWIADTSSTFSSMVFYDHSLSVHTLPKKDSLRIKIYFRVTNGDNKENTLIYDDLVESTMVVKPFFIDREHQFGRQFPNTNKPPYVNGSMIRVFRCDGRVVREYKKNDIKKQLFFNAVNIGSGLYIFKDDFEKYGTFGSIK
jgi:hypothetical protein